MNQELRFGVGTPFPTVPFETMIEGWQYIERLGFDSLWWGDHFVNWANVDNWADPWYEAWTLLAAMASYTSRIRIGIFICTAFRNPAFLARQALTVDHLSKGRLELGLGPGFSHDISYEMIGMENWGPRERVARFSEVVEIVDLLLRNEVTTYDGQYYQLKEAVMNPPPVQNPRPPFTILALGPVMLKHTARYADTWNHPGFGFPGTLEERFEETRHRNKLLDEYCEKINRDPQTLRRSVMIFEPEARTRGGLMKIYESEKDFTDIIERYLDIGMTEILLYFPFVKEQLAMFEKIAKETIPKLKAS